MRPASLITEDGFRKATNIGIGRGRKHLAPIDALLHKWDTQRPPTSDGRIVHLNALIRACTDWITNKGGKESDNFTKRQSQVSALREQARKLLAYEQFELKKTRARNRPLNPAGVALQAGYAVERTQFMQQRAALRHANQYGEAATISPIGGSYVHDVHTRHPLGTAPAQFEHLTTADYTAYLQANIDSMQNKYVHYMRKQERLDYMLTVSNGLLMLGGQLYSTPVAITIYAMDLYGNLFIQKSTSAGRTVGNDDSQFNHSSLNAGNDVICAGEIVVVNGVLHEISNGSGHYRPSAANLAECLTELVNDGLDINNTTVVVHTAAGHNQLAAAAFLQNPNAAPPPAPVVLPVVAPVVAVPAPTGWVRARRPGG